MKIHLWHIEAAAVAAVLSVVVVATGNSWREWLGAGAVFLSFMHGQVSRDLAVDQARRETPSVSCYRWAGRYFIGKEVLWFAYFLASQTWSALAGVVLFLVYPLWRRYIEGRRTA